MPGIGSGAVSLQWRDDGEPASPAVVTTSCVGEVYRMPYLAQAPFV